MGTKISKSHLEEFRKELHRNPELSDNEKQTALRIKNFISEFGPDEIIEGIGGYGLAFVFRGDKEGPCILFRSELDALPIDEVNTFSYRSVEAGISHKCGHDGHMTILSGFAEVIAGDRPKKGSIVLLFQPSEETGQGARRVLKDPKFKTIKPDYVFALHNLPGYQLGSVIVKENIFSSASIGLITRLKGKTSHAAEPEKGLNPAFAMAAVLSEFEKFNNTERKEERIQIITPIFVRLGEKAFGTNPGYAEMMFTIRATFTEDFEMLKKYTLENIREQVSAAGLQLEHEWIEEFPNTMNNSECVEIIKQAAHLSDIKIEELKYPFRWSEDFGHFLKDFKGAIFGIGSGMDQPALHNPDFDFPDELIETGINMFNNISKIVLK